MSTNTQDTYKRGLEAFEQFRLQYGLPLCWPPVVDHIINFVAFLSSKKLSHSTAKCYLAGISNMLNLHNLPNPVQSFIVQKMMVGYKREKPSSDIRSPITLPLLVKILGVLPHVTFSTYENDLFSGAFTLAFFALLRVGELAVTKGNSWEKIVQVDDVSLKPNTILVRIRCSKTDQYAKGSIVEIPYSMDSSVLFKALTSYIARRPKSQGPFFCHENGKSITAYQFSAILHKALKFLEIDTKTFKTHSFRIGAATFLYMKGCSEDDIKSNGRWVSNAYQSYIRPYSIHPMSK